MTLKAKSNFKRAVSLFGNKFALKLNKCKFYGELGEEHAVPYSEYEHYLECSRDVRFNIGWTVKTLKDEIIVFHDNKAFCWTNKKYAFEMSY